MIKIRLLEISGLVEPMFLLANFSSITRCFSILACDDQGHKLPQTLKLLKGYLKIILRALNTPTGFMMFGALIGLVHRPLVRNIMENLMAIFISSKFLQERTASLISAVRKQLTAVKKSKKLFSNNCTVGRIVLRRNEKSLLAFLLGLLIFLHCKYFQSQ